MSGQPADATYWRSARTIRERARTVLARGVAGHLEHFTVRMEALRPLAIRVAAIAREAYPDLRHVPVHGRYRHFGTTRLHDLDQRIAGSSREGKLAARADVVMISVLLDAGAGPGWRYRDPLTGEHAGRSEGLALASYDWVAGGGLSALGGRDPVRADAARVTAVSAEALGAAFQVRSDNVLVGLAGRAALLSRLAAAVRSHPALFGQEEARPGNLAVTLARQAPNGEVQAEAILAGILEGLGSIWPGRETLDGVPLGDVWTHSALGRVPFHKLSQWLAYSLFEPFQQAGLRVVGDSALTGLAEYRNGGLFVDGDVVAVRDPRVLASTHGVGSDLVIEWRALTIALLDHIADELRNVVGLDEQALPLSRVLEAGTWRAGRVLARERRADGGPPIQVASDGTVF